MKLYEIANEYQSVLNNLYDDETGEINETASVKLQEVGRSMEEKAIAVASFIKNIDADRKSIEEAKKMMAAREARLEKRVEWLTNYLITNMERTGKTEISCPYFEIKLKKNPVSTQILDETKIPDEYKKVKETISFDKIKIKSDIQNGVIVPGANLTQTLKLDIK